MRVKLTYFKPGGKYYSSGEYTTDLPVHDIGHPASHPRSTNSPYLFEIHNEVRRMAEERRCPDLVEGHSQFLVLVDVPEHPHNHPHLIVPNAIRQALVDAGVIS
jgi:hypothetical protein